MNDALLTIGALCDNCAEYCEDWTLYCDERLCMACVANSDRTTADISADMPDYDKVTWGASGGSALDNYYPPAEVRWF